MYLISRTISLAALALGLALASRTALAAPGVFADLDNDGQLSAGDVMVDDLLADGRFSTAEAEGPYTPPTGPVGLVIPASVKKLVTKDNLILIASGDVTIDADIQAASADALLLIVSTGGQIKVAPGVKLVGGDFVKLSAEGDILIGGGAGLSTKGHDFGNVLSIVSRTGDVVVGDKATLNGGGLCQVATPDVGGGQISIGPRSKLSASDGSVQVTAGLDLTMDGVQVTSPSIFLGSHASIHSPGHAMIRGASLKAGGDDGRIRIYADGVGGMVDLTDTRMRLSNLGNVLITADQVVHGSK